MNKKYYELIDESLYHFKVSNGLNVFMLKKEGYTKTYGILGTNFGSTNNQYLVNNIKHHVIDGAAHFLEHKMFEKNNYDVMDLFNKQQASCNAFTSFDKTAYLFSATGNINKNVSTLLDFVQDLELSDESVEKEKPIIAQEISMYDDDVSWQSFFQSIGSMYHNNSVKLDIAGDKESIYKISKDDLYTYYNYFYHPSNMVLFICGNFDLLEMKETIINNQDAKTFENLSFEYIYEEEPKEVVNKNLTYHMDINNDRLVVGFKMNEYQLEPLKQDLAMGILMDILFSKKTAFYQDLFDQKLISDNYSYQYYQNEKQDYAFAQMFFTSDDTTQVIKTMEDYFNDDLVKFINEEDFKIIKARYLGDFIRLFNSPDKIANSFISYHLAGYDLFKVIDIINDITLEDLKKLTSLFDLEYVTYTTITKEK